MSEAQGIGERSSRDRARSVLSLFAAALLGAWTLFGPDLLPVPDPPLRVGVDDRVGPSLLLLATDEGRVDPALVRIRELATTEDLALGLRNGTFDAATMTLDDALTVVDTGGDIVVLAALDRSRGADAIVAAPGVADVAALRGRRVGCENTASALDTRDAVLATAGLTAADIDAVEVAADRHEAAFAAGEVDAVVTFEPALSALLASGARPLGDGAAGEPRYDLLVAQRSVLATRAAGIGALREAWFAAVESLQRERERTLSQMAVCTGRSPQVLAAALARVTLLGAKDQAPLLEGSSPGLLEPASQVARRLLRERRLRREDCATRLLGLPSGDAGGRDPGVNR